MLDSSSSVHLQHTRPLSVHVVSLPLPQAVDLASIIRSIALLSPIETTLFVTYTLLRASTTLRTNSSFTLSFHKLQSELFWVS